MRANLNPARDGRGESMDEKIRIMVDAAILMENSFDGRQMCASDLLPLARLAGPLAREVERLTAELEEARLRLAAEQGRAEGAPSEGWESTITEWRKGRMRVRRQGWGWGWVLLEDPPSRRSIAAGVADTARSAMLAADASK